jgi:hypothetical protein
MFRTRAAKALLIPVMVASASVGTLAFASASGAAVKPATSSVKCTALSGTVGGTGSLTGCTDTANTGGSGSFPLVPGSNSVTWAAGGTNTFSYTFKTVTPNACPKKNEEIAVAGTVTGSTGSGSSIPNGDKVKGDLCVNKKTDVVELLPGTKFKL